MKPEHEEALKNFTDQIHINFPETKKGKIEIILRMYNVGFLDMNETIEMLDGLGGEDD